MSKSTPSTSTDKKDAVLEEFHDPVRNTAQAMRHGRRHSDARSIREQFGIASWDGDAWDHPSTLPDMMEHSWDAPPERASGGTDLLCRGQPGTGKSNLATFLALRGMEVNEEKVVWRGSSSRSEWLPLAPWTRLCLPTDTDISARLEPKRPTDEIVPLEVEDLEEIVREIVRYDSPTDLNQNRLQKGAFHVVYPDPRMRGCEQVYQDSPERSYDAPSGRDQLFHEDDPASHWWFAWALARVERGPHDWTTWMCDEIGDLAPQSAMKDQAGTFQKVNLLKDAWVDLRKYGVSVFMFAHSEKDIHEKIRRKLRWRVQMPDTANPTTGSDVVGWESVPMNHDIISDYKVGTALCYTETRFERCIFDEMPTPTEYALKIEVEA